MARSKLRNELSNASGSEQPIGDQELDPETLARARATVDKLKRLYASEWAPSALDEIEHSLALARASRSGLEAHFEVVYRLSHDMKGQGGTFGIPILSEIGASLCNFTSGREYAGDQEFEALEAHVAAARRVLAEQIVDSESAAGKEVMLTLKRSVRSYLH